MRHFLIPHENNDHRPYLLRHPALALFLALLLTAQTTLNLFYSTQPKILGFATSVYQQELIELTNKKRAEKGLSSLKHNPKLDQAAKLKAADMFSDDYWAHVAPDGTDPWHWFKQAGYDYYMAGENLARDFNTSAGVVSAWMASPTHRENLMQKEFKEIGMAVVNGELDGEETTLVVQMFATPAISASARPKSSGSIAAALAREPTNSPTAVPTVTFAPTATLTPTPQLFAESVAAGTNQSDDFKPLGAPALSKTSQLMVAASPSSWSLGQEVMLASLAALLLLFVTDSVILWRKGVLRQNSHSLLHAGVLGMLILAVIWSTTGVIL